LVNIKKTSGRANTSELGLFQHTAPSRTWSQKSKLKTDTVLDDETSEIERALCAFGFIGGSAPTPIK